MSNGNYTGIDLPATADSYEKNLKLFWEYGWHPKWVICMLFASDFKLTYTFYKTVYISECVSFRKISYF